MDLGDILTKEQIITDLRASNRWEAIDELINNLVTTGRIKPEHHEAIAAVVKKRESSMSTGIGFGIGIPHASTDLIYEVVGSLGRSKTGVSFDALDNQPVNLVMLFLVPQGQFQKHLHTLANIAKLLHKAEFRQALEQAPDAESMLKIIRDQGQKVAGSLLPYTAIQQRLQAAVKLVLPDADTSSVLVQPCPDPKFGDYQSNALMALAKARKMNPRQLATDVVARLELTDVCDKVEVAGAGFLNFQLSPGAVAQTLESALTGGTLFYEKTSAPKTVVVDFSSPNVAKPMHVGHIRSTVLGDALARVLRLLGHRVVTDNHIGDWGTQFGMLLVGWKTVSDADALKADPLKEMERIYKLISGRCDPDKPGFDPETLDRARAELVKLQAGEPENLEIWKEMIRLSQAQFETIYGRLRVKFDYTLGESFYNSRLPAVVSDLMQAGVAVESRGAKAVLSHGALPPKEDPFLIQKEGEWVANPFIVQKQDGGFNYATTDLATLAYRLETWQADEVIYVTDGRQQLHFRQLFAAFQRWRPEVKTKLAHVWFGSILGEDGKPFKTRSGETVRLSDLLDEAEQRALQVVSDKSPDLPEPARREIARVVGIGAVKYADLLPNRQSDYVFSWEKLLALNGNTAPYLQYAFARIRSIFRKGGLEGTTGMPTKGLQISEPQERALARHLFNFGLVLEGVAQEYRPNFLCNYLYELAGHFTTFYEKCPVLKAEADVRASRLVLCDLTAQVLREGLTILGIETLEQM